MIRDYFEKTLVEIPPDGWTMGHVTIRLRDPEERISIEAWRRGAFAIHEVKDGARITHAPTGLTIWTTSFFDGAVEVVEAIEGLTDWSSIKEAAPIGGDLYRRMYETILALDLEKCQ